jgi:hypothetical protein
MMVQEGISFWANLSIFLEFWKMCEIGKNFGIFRTLMST